LTTGRIAPHMDSSVVFATGGAIVHPPNTCFLGPAEVPIPNGISIGSAVFGRPFVKRFALCYRTVVYRVCL